MLAKNVVCVVADRLHTGMLGATAIAGFARLTSTRWLASRFSSTRHSSTALSLKTCIGRYGFPIRTRRPRTSRSGRVWPTVTGRVDAHDAGDRRFVGHGFRRRRRLPERVLVDCPIEPQTAAPDIDDTQLARLFGTATESILAARQPFFAWIHTRAMAHGWDAPYALREQYADVEDPRPTDLVQVPDFRLQRRLRSRPPAGHHACLRRAGVSASIIHWEDLSRNSRRSGLSSCTQLTFLSARGYPLGEHQRDRTVR